MNENERFSTINQADSDHDSYENSEENSPEKKNVEKGKIKALNIRKNVDTLKENENVKINAFTEETPFLRNRIPEKDIYIDRDKIVGGIDRVDSKFISLFGKALSSCKIGKKTGILTDGSALALGVRYSLIGSLMLNNNRVWDFGEGFYSQLEFYVRFCSLKSGVFISQNKDKVEIIICGENGLPLRFEELQEIKRRIEQRDFNLPDYKDIKYPSEMSSVNMMYRRELVMQSDSELSDILCSVKSQNDKISMLADDCFYRLGCKKGDGIQFKINRYGTRLSAFSRECGWVNHDKVSAIILNYEFKCGRAVGISYDSPFVFDKLAETEHAKIYRYHKLPVGSDDDVARELSRQNPFMRDALFMAVRLLNIISVTGKSLSKLVSELPDFYVYRKRLKTDLTLEEILNRLQADDYTLTPECATVNFKNGKALIEASSYGKKLNILSESVNYELSKEFVTEIEKITENK